MRLSDVPRAMLIKLGAPLNIMPEEMIVEQGEDRVIKVYYNHTESDEDYAARVAELRAAAAEERRQAIIAQEVEISWQKFLQLADRFKDRILVLTLKPESANG